MVHEYFTAAVYFISVFKRKMPSNGENAELHLKLIQLILLYKLIPTKCLLSKTQNPLLTQKNGVPEAESHMESHPSSLKLQTSTFLSCPPETSWMLTYTN